MKRLSFSAWFKAQFGETSTDYDVGRLTQQVDKCAEDLCNARAALWAAELRVTRTDAALKAWCVPEDQKKKGK